MPTPQQTKTRKKNGRQNSLPDAARIESLKQQYQALKSSQARAFFFRQLSPEERHQLLLLHHDSLPSDRARARFRKQLSSADLHSLMWAMTYEGHQQGRRLG